MGKINNQLTWIHKQIWPGELVHAVCNDGPHQQVNLVMYCALICKIDPMSCLKSQCSHFLAFYISAPSHGDKLSFRPKMAHWQHFFFFAFSKPKIIKLP